MLRETDRGLYCPAGGFHIDPWGAVDRAIITHAHGDHLAWGSSAYLTSEAGAPLASARLGGVPVEGLPYGERRRIGEVVVSLHPAGHILGSSQVRVEHRGEVWVVSGDYKLEPDPTATAWEPVRCHTFVTESTFGLPVYRWPPHDQVVADIHEWWRQNQAVGRTSVIYAYALGKAQRVLASLDPSTGPILVHGAVEHMTSLYREAGVLLPPTASATTEQRPDWARAIVLAPPSAGGSPWARRFGDASTAMTSGWMRVRGTRRRQGVDRGFVLSDHADWPGLLRAIDATGARSVWVTHGFTGPLVRWLEGQGLDARAVATRFEAGAEDLDPWRHDGQ
jgi:putative mRNA 3-end processing factor